MASYAYVDKLKTTYVLAKYCNANDIGKDFYCPDPDCNGVVHLCAYNSNHVNNYFKGNNHSNNCSFYKNNVNYRIENFNTLDFSPSNLLSHIQQPTNNKNKNNSNGKAKKTKLNVKKTNKYIHSIKSLYYLAINYPIDKEINGYRISDLVCYNKTSHIYIKYIKGLKLIVCKFHRYDSINKCIYFNYHSKQNIIKIKACFNDVKMYTDIKNRIYGYKGNVLLFANWSIDSNYTYATITTAKQITVTNQEHNSV